MPNMSLTKVPMPEQDPNVRNKNFEEVALGYTEEMAIEEATRCINCKNKPCMSGCPVCVRIPEFIAKVAAGEFEEAYKIITSTNGLPAVCGRVCPQENQCEGKCVRGIKGEPVSIGRLERLNLMVLRLQLLVQVLQDLHVPVTLQNLVTKLLFLKLSTKPVVFWFTVFLNLDFLRLSFRRKLKILKL